MIVAGTPVAAASRCRRSGCGPCGSRAAFSRAASTSSGVGSKRSTLCTTRHVLSLSLWSMRPRHEHDLVDAPARPRTRRSSSRTRSARPRPRGRRASRTSSASPVFVRIFLAWVMIPPAVTQSPSRRCGELGERAVDGLRAAPRGPPSAGAARRTGRSPPSRRRAARAGRTPRAGSAGAPGGTPPARTPARRRRRARPCRRSSPGRSARRAGTAGRRTAPARAPRACPCGVAPVEPNAPHLISASIARLLTSRASTRAQKSQSDSNGPSLLARAP